MKFGFKKKEEETDNSEPQEHIYSHTSLLMFWNYVNQFKTKGGWVNTDDVLVDLGIAKKDNQYFSLFDTKLAEYREFWNKYEQLNKLRSYWDFIKLVGNLGIYDKERFTPKSIQEVAQDKIIQGDREAVRN